MLVLVFSKNSSYYITLRISFLLVTDSDDEDEEVKSSLRQQHREAKKYQYNQYSSTPQLYGHSPLPEHFPSGGQYRGDSSPAQFDQGQQPPPQFLPPGQVVTLPQPTDTPPGTESIPQPALQQQIIIQQPPQLPNHPPPPGFQQAMYTAPGSHSPPPPPPWTTEPPPVSGPAQAMLPQQITLTSPHRVNPADQRLMPEEHRIYGEALPPPSPSFPAGPPPPGSAPQIIVPPHLPPPTQTIVSVPQFNGQSPPFPGQPPPQGGYQYPTGPPLTMSYWWSWACYRTADCKSAPSGCEWMKFYCEFNSVWLLLWCECCPSRKMITFECFLNSKWCHEMTNKMSI